MHNSEHYSEDVKIPMGPQHPSLKEPESFLISLRGEKITASSVRLGYNHRGIEKACEDRTYTQGLYQLSGFAVFVRIPTLLVFHRQLKKLPELKFLRVLNTCVP